MLEIIKEEKNDKKIEAKQPVLYFKENKAVERSPMKIAKAAGPLKVSVDLSENAEKKLAFPRPLPSVKDRMASDAQH